MALGDFQMLLLFASLGTVIAHPSNTFSSALEKENYTALQKRSNEHKLSDEKPKPRTYRSLFKLANSLITHQKGVQKHPSDQNNVYVIPQIRPGRSFLDGDIPSNLLSFNGKTSEGAAMKFGDSDSEVEDNFFVSEFEKRSYDMIPTLRFGRSDSMIPTVRFGRSNSMIPTVRFGRSNSMIPAVRFGRSDSMIPTVRFGKSVGSESEDVAKRSNDMIPVLRLGRTSGSMIPALRFGKSTESFSDGSRTEPFENSADYDGGQRVFENVGERASSPEYGGIDTVVLDDALYSDMKAKGNHEDGISDSEQTFNVDEASNSRLERDSDEGRNDSNDSMIPQIRYGRSVATLKSPRAKKPYFLLPKIRSGRSPKTAIPRKGKSKYPHVMLPYPRPGRSDVPYYPSIEEILDTIYNVFRRSDKHRSAIGRGETAVIAQVFEESKPVQSQVEKESSDEESAKSEGGRFIIPYPRPGKRRMLKAGSPKLPLASSNMADQQPHMFKIKESPKYSDYILPYPRPGKRSYFIDENDSMSDDDELLALSRPGTSRSDSPSSLVKRSDTVLPQLRFGKSGYLVPLPRPGRSNTIVPYPRPGRSNTMVPFPRPGRSNFMEQEHRKPDDLQT